MTGACLTVSQVQSIPWSAAPSSTRLLLVTSAFVTPIVTREVAAKPSAMRAAAVLEAPVSFQEKETGAGWRTRNGQADRWLLGRRVGWLPQGQRYLVGIHHMGSDRTSYRTRIVLAGEHRGSGVTFKVWVTWGAVIDSSCDSRSTLVDNIRQAARFQGFSACG